MASAVVQFRLLVGLDFQRKVQNTNWIHKDPEKAQKQNKKMVKPKKQRKQVICILHAVQAQCTSPLLRDV